MDKNGYKKRQKWMKNKVRIKEKLWIKWMKYENKNKGRMTKKVNGKSRWKKGENGDQMVEKGMRNGGENEWKMGGKMLEK